jgi:hypothetical protein
MTEVYSRGIIVVQKKRLKGGCYPRINFSSKKNLKFFRNRVKKKTMIFQNDDTSFSVGYRPRPWGEMGAQISYHPYMVVPINYRESPPSSVM